MKLLCFKLPRSIAQLVVDATSFAYNSVKSRLTHDHITLALVPATLVTNVSDAQINCTLGEGAATWQLGSIGVFVALGPQATYGPGTSFLRYPTPTLHALTPVLGVGNSRRL